MLGAYGDWATYSRDNDFAGARRRRVKDVPLQLRLEGAVQRQDQQALDVAVPDLAVVQHGLGLGQALAQVVDLVTACT